MWAGIQARSSCLVLSCLPLSEGRSVLAKAASSCWIDSTVETDCGRAGNTCKVESRSQRQSERRRQEMLR